MVSVNDVRLRLRPKRNVQLLLDSGISGLISGGTQKTPYLAMRLRSHWRTIVLLQMIKVSMQTPLLTSDSA